jgi:hypothetical protein
MGTCSLVAIDNKGNAANSVCYATVSLKAMLIDVYPSQKFYACYYCM